MREPHAEGGVTHGARSGASMLRRPATPTAGGIPRSSRACNRVTGRFGVIQKPHGFSPGRVFADYAGMSALAR